MTKKIIKLNIFCALFIVILNNTGQSVSAATPTPTTKQPTVTVSDKVSPTEEKAGEKLNDQINQLKERIASKVAELNLVEKRGVVGEVAEASGNQISITDLSGKTRFIDVDEITKFSSQSAKSFGLSDIVKGTRISILGLYNKQSQRILGRFIESFTSPTFITGRIGQIDRKNFTITLVSENEKQTKIDIETATRISINTKDGGTEKYGFSKLEIGNVILVTGYPEKSAPGLISGTRVLYLPELPKNPKIIITEPTVIEEDITPSASKTKTSPTPSNSR